MHVCGDSATGTQKYARVAAIGLLRLRESRNIFYTLLLPNKVYLCYRQGVMLVKNVLLSINVILYRFKSSFIPCNHGALAYSSAKVANKDGYADHPPHQIPHQHS